jgi:hypothetical protein
VEKKTNKKKTLSLKNTQINEISFFTNISQIIEKRKYQARMYTNREVTLIYIKIDYYIYNEIIYISILVRESKKCQQQKHISPR